jgi:hypothetical protein
LLSDPSKVKKFEELDWMAWLMYLSSIFQHLQKANLSLQGKKNNVFVLNSCIESLKTKVELWKTKAEQSDFSSFAELNEFLHTCEWETLETNLP